MKKLLLTQGKYALLDDPDHKRASEYKWYYCHLAYNKAAQKNFGDFARVNSLEGKLYG